MAEIAERWTMTAADVPLMAIRYDPFPPGIADVVAEVAASGACQPDLGDAQGGVRSNQVRLPTLGHGVSGHVALAPFVERHPLSEINDVFEAVRAGKSNPRAILVP